MGLAAAKPDRIMQGAAGGNIARPADIALAVKLLNPADAATWPWTDDGHHRGRRDTESSIEYPPGPTYQDKEAPS
jgi:hypothetical protein